jgi:hypothetical protein
MEIYVAIVLEALIEPDMSSYTEGEQRPNP